MKPLYWILLALLTLATLGLPLLDRDQAHAHAWEAIPLFYAAFGFVGCLLLIVIAKLLGKAVLEKPEDYYDRDR
jgi:energy-converting hydrogenase Eha subunit A